MEASKIKAELEALEQKLRDLGYVMVKAELSVKFLSEGITVALEYRSNAYAKAQNLYLYTTVEDSFEAAFKKAEERISNLPSVRDQQVRDFTAAVGKLIDHGREIGVEVDFLNPLTDMMKKLSSNIITKVEELPF